MKLFGKFPFIALFLPMLVTLASPAHACSTHNHLCTYHALGVPRTSYDVDNDETRLVIYAKATHTSHGDEQTDFDNHVLLPTQTTDFDWLGKPTTDTTEPFINSRTSYGNTHKSDVSEWETPNTRGAHVYGSQYQVIFNKNTAQAIHTGDLNGGEEGRTPYQTGCPGYEGKANCEAVVITGNVPNGIYSQKVQMFNFYNKDDPAVELELGAWVTGQGTLITGSHLDSDSSVAYINDSLDQGREIEHNFTRLEGDKAKTQQFDYEFHNRGFDPHAVGVTAWNYGYNPHKRYSDPYEVFNHKTGNIDLKKQAYSFYTYKTSIVLPDGKLIDEDHRTQTSTRTLDMGSIGCTDGISSGVRCDQDGVARLGLNGAITPEALALMVEVQAKINANNNMSYPTSEYATNSNTQMSVPTSFTPVLDFSDYKVTTWTNDNGETVTIDTRTTAEKILAGDPLFSEFEVQNTPLFEDYCKVGSGCKPMSVLDVVSTTEISGVGEILTADVAVDKEWIGQDKFHETTIVKKVFNIIPYTEDWDMGRYETDENNNRVYHQRKPECRDYAVLQAKVCGGNPFGYKNRTDMYVDENNDSKKDFELGMNTIIKNLKEGKGVVAGVAYKDSKPGNANNMTNHYVTIVGMGKDEKGDYFHYYDNFVAEGTENPEEVGRSTENKFRLYKSRDGYILADIDGTSSYNSNIYSNENINFYTVTEVRDNDN